VSPVEDNRGFDKDVLYVVWFTYLANWHLIDNLLRIRQSLLATDIRRNLSPTWAMSKSFASKPLGFYACAAAYLVVVGVYLWLQFFSTRYETRYLIIAALLLGQGLGGLAIVRHTSKRHIKLPRIMQASLITWSIITLALLVTRLVFFDYLLVRSPDHITQQRVSVGVPHQNFSVTTQDGVRIAGYQIRSGHTKVIILAHGGASSKNSFENLSLAEWLSYDYDVISFDTRGHFESGGYWTGDGKTKLDLLAVLQFARSQGYEKVGVLGTSLGGWTAILVAAEQGDIYSLVVLSAPLGSIRETPEVSQIEMLKMWPGRMLVRAIQGLRYQDYQDSDTLTPKEVMRNLKAPTFMIYGERDDVVGLSKEDIEKAYKLIPGQKSLYIFPEAVHLPLPHNLGPIYRMTREWFAQTLGD
jgi:pimeloyl-ACP methyl ester carboxylesterase